MKRLDDSTIEADHTKRLLSDIARRDLLARRGEGRGVHYGPARKERAVARSGMRTPVSGSKSPDSAQRASGSRKSKNGEPPNSMGAPISAPIQTTRPSRRDQRGNRLTAMGIPANAKQLSGRHDSKPTYPLIAGMFHRKGAVEIWSAGTFPTGITPEKLSKSHQSVQRNPIIADVFYKTGLIEKWGRGTNRVIEMALEAGIAPPKFEEITGAAVVTFKVNVRGSQQTTDQFVGRLGTDAVPSRDQVGTKSKSYSSAVRNGLWLN